MTLLDVKPAAAKPAVFIEAAHYERLHALATLFLDRAPEAARNLLAEIERAAILEESGISVPVVTMGAKVTFRDENARRTQTVRLVYPSEADISERKVSVLTPIGAALIGLPEGARISWSGRRGERTLNVLRVVRPRVRAQA